MSSRQGLSLLSLHQVLNGKTAHNWSQVLLMKLLIALRLKLVLSVYNRICHLGLIPIYVRHLHKSFFMYRSVDNYGFA